MSDNNSKSMGDLFPDLGPEAPVISGVAHDRSEALATVRGVPNEPGMAAKVFTELATAGVNVDMIVQAGASVGTAEISFTVPESTVKEVENVLIDKHDELGYKSFDINRSVGTCVLHQAVQQLQRIRLEEIVGLQNADVLATRGVDAQVH